MILDWFARAWNQVHAPNEECFEPFVLAWFAFNGWAACVTGKDIDREWRDSLLVSEALSQAFEKALDDHGEFGAVTHEFAETWPIFDVRALQRRNLINLMLPSEGQRSAIVNRYLDRGATEFFPTCWSAHRARGMACPLDWPHTLEALYMVRCNLLHGRKAAHSEMDRLIVGAAFRTLVRFIHSSDIIQ